MRLHYKCYSMSVLFCITILAGCLYLKTNYRPCPDAGNRSKHYVETILSMTRLKIKYETWEYNLTYSGVNTLEDLVMESGGTPLRSVIVSTWRSGSTFLGDLLNAMPGNFYHYEPLIHYKNIQIRMEPHIIKAIRVLKNLLKCNYSGMEDYFKFVKTNMSYEYFTFNSRLWENCKYKRELCVDASFTADLCKLFPFQNMKTVRLRLRFFENMLDDEELNVKVVLLIRDPRGVMNSRKQIHFCRSQDCNPQSLCADMISDYMTANRLLQKFPERLMILRFEDLVLNLNGTTHKLLKFLRLEPNQSIEKFLVTHTQVNAGNGYSTFRVSHDVAFKWKTLLDFNSVAKIQAECKDAMGLWGYQVAENASHMTSDNFYPLKHGLFHNLFSSANLTDNVVE